ncbi:response regulator [uncultured Paenibacillus sp.]|uniref:response regulator n=1 Tax=uncultured Paenibacillus sp. TaxID=227322 RepID=UPI0028D5F3C8|nr:response regulator [uncultured Paenibacillus sp.]
MLKIVLVDDEERIRLGLAKLISQAGKDYQVTAVYSGANELLDDLDSMEADLLITDIKMPNMSGLELVGKLQKLRPKLRIAVLSGFDDFSFARQALRLGVEDYLLKPVDTGELGRLLLKVMQELERESLGGEIRQEDQLRLLLFNDPDNLPRQLQEDACRVLEQTHLFQDHFAVFAVHGSSSDLLRDIRFAAGVWQREWTAEPLSDREVAVIVTIGEHDHARTVSELGQTLLHRLPSSFRGRVGAGEVHRMPIRLREAYRQAVAAVQKAWYADGKRLLELYGRLPKEGYRRNAAQSLVALDREAGEALLLQDFTRVSISVRHWLDDFVQQRPPWPELRNGCGTVIAYLRSHSPAGVDSAELDPGQYPDKESFVESFMTAVDLMILSIRDEKQESRVIDTVKSYIHKHYAEEIELNTLAEEVFLTPSYLSKLFRTETGKTITDYMIAVRMERAKALLREQQGWKTYEVGEKVGYSDPAYFNKVFKRVVGCTPKEFRERVR